MENNKDINYLIKNKLSETEISVYLFYVKKFGRKYITISLDSFKEKLSEEGKNIHNAIKNDEFIELNSVDLEKVYNLHVLLQEQHRISTRADIYMYTPEDEKVREREKVNKLLEEFKSIL